MAVSTLFWRSQLERLWSDSAQQPFTERVGGLVHSSREMWRRHASASASPPVGEGTGENDKLTVILLNHKRPENVGLVAQYSLRANFVGKLIVSNNSQSYPIARYVPFKDSRLLLIDQDKPAGVGIRFEIAKNHPARYYLCLDDDVFLHPAQLQWLYWNLRQADDRPHGIFGAIRSPIAKAGDPWPFVHRRNHTGPVEILNGVFAFTAAQLAEFYRLCPLLGIDDPKSLMNGEDIVLSFSGDRKPMIHNIGAIWECASASSPGVAMHMSRPKFYEERWRIYSELRRIKPLIDDESPRRFELPANSDERLKPLSTERPVQEPRGSTPE